MNKTYVNKVKIGGDKGSYIGPGAVWVAGKNRYESANGEVFYYYVPKDVIEPKYILPSSFVENSPEIFQEQEVLMSAEEVVKYLFSSMRLDTSENVKITLVYNWTSFPDLLKSIKAILEK